MAIRVLTPFRRILIQNDGLVGATTRLVPCFGRAGFCWQGANNTPRSAPLREIGLGALLGATLVVSLIWSGRTPKAPADHGGLNRAAGFVVAPIAIDEAARKRQLIGSAMVFAEHLDRLIRWRVSLAIEFG
jgi:hypothetical protein